MPMLAQIQWCGEVRMPSSRSLQKYAPRRGTQKNHDVYVIHIADRGVPNARAYLSHH